MSDLKTLRTLAEYLFSFDAVTFLAYLDNLRITEGVSSVWLFHNAAHTIFEQVPLLPGIAVLECMSIPGGPHASSVVHELCHTSILMGVCAGQAACLLCAAQ